jgi:hypothetical protein
MSCNSLTTSVTLSGANGIAPIKTNICHLKNSCMFKLSIVSNGATTQSIFLSLCNDLLIPLYSSTTGLQIVGSDLVVGSCYLLFYDCNSSKAYIVA